MELFVIVTANIFKCHIPRDFQSVSIAFFLRTLTFQLLLLVCDCEKKVRFLNSYRETEQNNEAIGWICEWHAVLSPFPPFDFKTHPFSVERKKRFYHRHSTWFFFRCELKKNVPIHANKNQLNTLFFYSHHVCVCVFFCDGSAKSLSMVFFPCKVIESYTPNFFSLIRSTEKSVLSA